MDLIRDIVLDEDSSIALVKGKKVDLNTKINLYRKEHDEIVRLIQVFHSINIAARFGYGEIAEMARQQEEKCMDALYKRFRRNLEEIENYPNQKRVEVDTKGYSGKKHGKPKDVDMKGNAKNNKKKKR